MNPGEPEKNVKMRQETIVAKKGKPTSATPTSKTAKNNNSPQNNTAVPNKLKSNDTAAKKVVKNVKNNAATVSNEIKTSGTSEKVIEPVKSIVVASTTDETTTPVVVTNKQIPILPVVEEAKVVKDGQNNQEKTREQIKAEREAKKLEKQLHKKKSDSTANDIQKKLQDMQISPTENAKEFKEVPKEQVEQTAVDLKAKPVLSKAERRAVQEAQRAAKAQSQVDKTKKVEPKAAAKTVVEKEMPPVQKKSPCRKVVSPITKTQTHQVKLFSHLYLHHKNTRDFVNSSDLHPAIVKLGTQYATGVVTGSNARCIAFLHAMKAMIEDYKTPPQKEFARGLESLIPPSVAYLQQCRPLAVSVSNAIAFLTRQITQLPVIEEDDNLRERLLEAIDCYIDREMEKAAQAITIFLENKIDKNDVIMTFGCSSLIEHILKTAHGSEGSKGFRVVVVNARPLNEGQEMLRRLVARGINCKSVLISGVSFVMPEVTKVLLGAHGLLANGYVMSRAGTAQVALIAKSFNVPVLVCCEKHKFSERVQTDAFVYNEIGNPNDLLVKKGESNGQMSLNNWESNPQLTPLHLYYDVTPPELVTAVVTEVGILPCTSVPVILRIGSSEIAY